MIASIPAYGIHVKIPAADEYAMTLSVDSYLPCAPSIFRKVWRISAEVKRRGMQIISVIITAISEINKLIEERSVSVSRRTVIVVMTISKMTGSLYPPVLGIIEKNFFGFRMISFILSMNFVSSNSKTSTVSVSAVGFVSALTLRFMSSFFLFAAGFVCY